MFYVQAICLTPYWKNLTFFTQNVAHYTLKKLSDAPAIPEGPGIFPVGMAGIIICL